MYTVKRNCVFEITFISEKNYDNPYNIDLEVEFINENGEKKVVPCFWDGGKIFKCRFSTKNLGKYTFKSICDVDDNGLNNQYGNLNVIEYDLDNILYKKGALKVSNDQRHLCYDDNTPFLWLADTWWTGFTEKLSYKNGDFQNLTIDRKSKGFNAVQMTMGLFPDMKPFDICSKNEGGFSYIPQGDYTEDEFGGLNLDIYDEKNYEMINPDFFKYVDRKLEYLIDMEIVPVLFAMWGYFIDFMGVVKCQKFWKYIIARYSAYPVVFSYCGEATLMYYKSKIFGDWDKNDTHAIECWSQIAKNVKNIEPFGRLFTIHSPTRDYKYTGKETLNDYNLMDFNMIQSFHGAFDYKHTVKVLRYAREIEPKKPYLIGEAYFEGILEQSREEVQRQVFWASICNGAFGYTYGANGIWQLNEENNPFRNNPIGVHWGDTPWKEAKDLKGATQLGLGKEFLEEFEWDKFEPHQEWVISINDDAVDKDEYAGNEPWACGIPGKIRIIYFSNTHAPLLPLKYIKDVEDDRYVVYLVNPSTFEKFCYGRIIPTMGLIEVPKVPSNRDWVLLLIAE